MKGFVLNYLLEEAKFLSTAQKEAQKKFLMSLTETQLFDMLLEKSRAQGIDSVITYGAKLFSVWDMKGKQ